MPSYRVEHASSGRALCQNKECKDQKIKITKGELRHGSWVDSGQYQSWSWRHWGCVTPKVISNINDLIGEGDDRDLDMLDGYDELPSDLQDKIKRALEQGHVDDADWKGDVEVNRPGQTGFRIRASKKKAKDESKDADKEDKDDAADDDEAPRSSKTKKRGRLQEDEYGKDAKTAQPKRPKRKSTGYPKKAPVSSDEDDEEDDDFELPEPESKASKRGRPAKDAKSAASTAKRGQKSKGTAEDDETEPAAAKRKRARKST
ncbi:hypothetical protein BDW69DRAFT_156725 [Aspergillus filifer]